MPPTSTYRDCVTRTSKIATSSRVGRPGRGTPQARRRPIARLPSVFAIATIVAATFSVTPLCFNAFATTTHGSSNPAKGLFIRGVNGVRYGVRTAIRVLSFDASQYHLAIGLANNAVDGSLQTPSSMCRGLAGCVAAVNGDYYDVTRVGRADPGDEVGGVIQNCVLLHTPEIAHQQADLDGQRVSQGMDWSVNVNIHGVTVPITAVNQELPMQYLNVNLPLAGNLLFTTPFVLRTPAAAGRSTYEFIQVSNTSSPTTSTTAISSTSTTMGPTTSTTTGSTTTSTTLPLTNSTTSPTTINTSTELEYVAQTTKAVRIRAGQVDISAPTGSLFATLQIGDTVTLSTTSKSGCNNIGGHPILLSNGSVVPIDVADTYMAQRYPRTVIGWTASGSTVIMIVEGVDGKSGATGRQLVRLLQSLNVVTALDLDGGDSTSLYAKGHSYYHAGQSERPVSTGLLVVKTR